MSKLSFLCLYIFILRTLAGPQSTQSHAARQWNSDAFNVIPRCAYDCFTTFISYSFPTSVCPNAEDLVCLCTSDSRSGFTLGEGALRCLASGCEPDTTTDFQNAYEICKGVANAQPETHATISASMLAPTTIIVPTSAGAAATNEPFQSSEPSQTLHSHGRQTTKSVVLDTSTRLPFATPSRISSNPANGDPSSPSNSALAASAASASASAAPVLNHAQVVGVAVSGGVVGSAAFGLLFFIFCIKNKRDRRRRDSDASFGVTGELGGLANRPRTLSGNVALARAATDPNMPKTVRLLGAPGGPGQKRWTLWRKAMEKHASPDPQMQEAVFAISPPSQRAVTHDSSPASVKSYHTSSALLPEMPSMKHSKSPKQTSRFAISKVPERKPVNGTPGAGLTVAPQTERRDESAWRQEGPIQRPPPNFALRHQTSDPFIENQDDPRARLYAMERRKASNADLPRIVPPGDQRQLGSPWKYVPEPLFSKQQQIDSHDEVINFPESAAYVPANPAKASEQTARNRRLSYTPHSDNANPSNDQGSFNKWAALKTRRGSNNRPLTNYTAGSDTSFEDDGDTPNELPSQSSSLSPVRESAQRKEAVTPIRDVRYPAVPGRGASVKRLQVSPPNQWSPNKPGQASAGGRAKLVDVGRSPKLPSPQRVSHDPYGETPVELPVRYVEYDDYNHYEDADYITHADANNQKQRQGQGQRQRQQLHPQAQARGQGQRQRLQPPPQQQQQRHHQTFTPYMRDAMNGGSAESESPQWEITRSPGVAGMETWGGSPKSPRSREDRHFPSSRGYGNGSGNGYAAAGGRGGSGQQQYQHQQYQQQQRVNGASASASASASAPRPRLPPPQPQWEYLWR